MSAAKGEANRIKHALYSPSWAWGDGDKSVLKSTAQRKLVSEYEPDYRGKIFCPECCCPLYRSPDRDDANKRGRSAFYGHRKNIKTDCGLRTKPAQGKRYDTEEDAKQAILNGDMVIIEGFMQERPVAPSKNPDVYNETPVEDINGEPADVPISRHRGESFNLPSKISTVAGLCRKFDENYYKYYFLPNSQHAVQLMDLLVGIHPELKKGSGPMLLYGKVVGVTDFGRGGPNNARFVYLETPNNCSFKDFVLKFTVAEGNERGLARESVGRIVIAYGSVRENGIGLALASLGWGEVSLLPTKYEHLLL
ncbi:hypothetical protein K5D32_02460 [Pseudomonas cichorii]|uniref:hypothetical protein n=1 Tax=Pseudomonas cichorii TaxID=36746 RepID=UPI001C890190|nr:hypothetical protein [Pseudomonas cichorii]MBX8528505.1 hypothetical protein [Pseudomonas cichorii]